MTVEQAQYVNQSNQQHQRQYKGNTVSNSALGLLYGHGILTIYENLLL